MKPEETVETYLCRQAEKLGFLCYKFTSPGQAGVPDRMLVGYGMTFFIETKAPGEKPRKLQEYVISKMQNHGALVFVADNKKTIDNILSDIINKANSNKKHQRKTPPVSGKVDNDQFQGNA